MFRQVSFIVSEMEQREVKRVVAIVREHSVFECYYRRCRGTSDTFEIFCARMDGKSMTVAGIEAAAQHIKMAHLG